MFWTLDPSVVSSEWVWPKPGLNSLLHGSASKFCSLSLSLGRNINIDCKDIYLIIWCEIWWKVLTRKSVNMLELKKKSVEAWNLMKTVSFSLFLIGGADSLIKLRLHPFSCFNNQNCMDPFERFVYSHTFSYEVCN